MIILRDYWDLKVLVPWWQLKSLSFVVDGVYPEGGYSWEDLFGKFNIMSLYNYLQLLRD